MPLALVTGANQGIGLEVCRQLRANGYDVIVASRDLGRGEEAARKLGGGRGVRVVQLDVASPESVARAAGEVSKGLQLDTLVNNAGATFDGFDAGVAARTLETNYRGPARVTDALLSHLAPHARVVMVSSGMGEVSVLSKPLAARLLDPTLDRPGLDAIAQEFVDGVATGDHRKRGFPDNAYSVSKALLNALTRILARSPRLAGYEINAVCPGWVKTRMGGAGAPRSVEEGARGIVWAATLPEGGPTGGFFRDGLPIDW